MFDEILGTGAIAGILVAAGLALGLTDRRHLDFRWLLAANFVKTAFVLFPLG